APIKYVLGFLSLRPHTTIYTLFPYTTLFRSHAYDPSGEPTLLFRRNVPFRGRCIMHRPLLEILPTYVRPAPGVTSMASILDLPRDRKSTRLNSSHVKISYAVFCLQKKINSIG